MAEILDDYSYNKPKNYRVLKSERKSVILDDADEGNIHGEAFREIKKYAVEQRQYISKNNNTAFTVRFVGATYYGDARDNSVYYDKEYLGKWILTFDVDFVEFHG